ncbi:hypothetical protein BT69DRAFT_1347066 [Atractiella rhizophila]|nr:hypothetical protein BT69DRAFT_1357721 [Atractiella rhizophila]KAH8927753.1 hypothetical protein BT69DRAFT_1347066 [Atractiella rhizophila]
MKSQTPEQIASTSQTPSPPSSAVSTTAPKKQNKTKITRNRKYLACDACRKWRRKCEKESEMDKCKGCSDREICCETTYVRKPRSSDKVTKQAEAVKFLSQPPNSVNALYPSWGMPFPVYPQAMRAPIFPPFPLDNRLNDQSLVGSIPPPLLEHFQLTSALQSHVQNAYPVSYDMLRLPSLPEDVKPPLPTVSAAHIPYHLVNANGF